MQNLNNALRDLENINRNSGVQSLLKEILAELKAIHKLLDTKLTDEEHT